MPQRYLISFDDGAMDHIPEAELAAAGEAAHGVVAEARHAGAWIFGGGIGRQRASIVAVDGAVSEGPEPDAKVALGGFAIFEVETREEALEWAAKLAVACRCAQEVREIFYDAES